MPEYIEYSDNSNCHFNGSNSILNNLSISSEEWKDWTIFCVFKNVTTSSRTQAIFTLTQENAKSNTLIGFFADTTYILGSGTGYRFSIANNDNESENHLFLQEELDTNKHIAEFSSNNGVINCWLDGNHTIIDENDFRPKTIGEINVGSRWVNGKFGYYAHQLDAHLVRLIIFNRNLTNDERTFVRNLINEQHDVY